MSETTNSSDNPQGTPAHPFETTNPEQYGIPTIWNPVVNLEISNEEYTVKGTQASTKDQIDSSKGNPVSTSGFPEASANFAINSGPFSNKDTAQKFDVPDSSDPSSSFLYASGSVLGTEAGSPSIDSNLRKALVLPNASKDEAYGNMRQKKKESVKRSNYALYMSEQMEGYVRMLRDENSRLQIQVSTLGQQMQVLQMQYGIVYEQCRNLEIQIWTERSNSAQMICTNCYSRRQ